MNRLKLFTYKNNHYVHKRWERMQRRAGRVEENITYWYNVRFGEQGFYILKNLGGNAKDLSIDRNSVSFNVKMSPTRRV